MTLINAKILDDGNREVGEQNFPHKQITHKKKKNSEITDGLGLFTLKTMYLDHFQKQ